MRICPQRDNSVSPREGVHLLRVDLFAVMQHLAPPKASFGFSDEEDDNTSTIEDSEIRVRASRVYRTLMGAL